MCGFEVNPMDLCEKYPMAMEDYSMSLVNKMKLQLRSGYSMIFSNKIVYVCQYNDGSVKGPLKQKRCHGTLNVNIEVKDKRVFEKCGMYNVPKSIQCTVFRIDTVRLIPDLTSEFDILIGKDILNRFLI